MKGWLVSLVLAGAAAVGIYGLSRSIGADVDPECDMERTVEGYYCEPCDFALEAEDRVSGVAHHVCTGCGRTDRTPGLCRFCGADSAPKRSGVNVCPRCLAAPGPARLCVKDGYRCPRCGTSALQAGACEACDGTLVEWTFMAVIQYQCEQWDCPEGSYGPGVCANPECRRRGRELVPCCSESGVTPHVKKERRIRR